MNSNGLFQMEKLQFRLCCFPDLKPERVSKLPVIVELPTAEGTNVARGVVRDINLESPKQPTLNEDH